MNEGFSTEAFFSFLRRNLFLSGITLTGCLLLLFGIFGINLIHPSEESVVYESNTETQPKTESKVTEEKGTIFVDIAGAVNKPGVYEVKGDARVQDVLTKANGLSEKADAQGIAKAINLASKVADGMKLYFPFKGENISSSNVQGISQSVDLNSSSGLGSTQVGGLINLNQSSQSELESLPGIGAVTALKIIKSRPYGSVQDIKDKKVVGESVYSKIKDLVTVN